MLEALTNCPNPLDYILSDRSESDISRASILGFQRPELFSHWLDTSTVSFASLTLAFHWLNTCLCQHRPCDIGLPAREVSTRFINIAEPCTPRLTSEHDLTEPYVTLSYEWGEENRFVTTTENVHQHKEGIYLQILPAAFQEAFHVAHFLGFRFIWIDAFCIIQDSDEDKARQIGIMDQIFRHSRLTLFAATGNVQSPLGIERDPRCIKPCRLDLKSSLDGKTMQRPSYIEVGRNGLRWPTQPLFRRGWVAQEQILAPRAIIFGPRELAWQCTCGGASESSPSIHGSIKNINELVRPTTHGLQFFSVHEDGFDLLRLSIAHNDSMMDQTGLQRNNHFDHWYKFIKNYSKRNLTFPADVLLAIQGLANALGSNYHCEYHFGLWLDDLQVGLAWYVSNERLENQSDGHSGQSIVETNMLPSWSWASRWGNAIRFRRYWDEHSLVEDLGIQQVGSELNVKGACFEQSKALGLYEGQTDHESDRHSEKIRDIFHRRYPDVDSKDKHQASSSQKGIHQVSEDAGSNTITRSSTQVETKGLTLGGYVKIGRINYCSNPRLRSWNESSRGPYDGHEPGWMRNLDDPVTSKTIGYIALDSEPPIGAKSQIIHCLLCTVKESGAKRQLTCLGLVPADAHSNNFVRIGLVFIRWNKWLGPLSAKRYGSDMRREQINRKYRREYRILTVI